MLEIVEKVTELDPPELFAYVLSLPEAERRDRFNEVLSELGKEIENGEKHIVLTAYMAFLLALADAERSYRNLEKLKGAYLNNEKVSGEYKRSFVYAIVISLDDPRLIGNLSLDFLKSLRAQIPDDENYADVRELLDIYEEIVQAMKIGGTGQAGT